MEKQGHSMSAAHIPEDLQGKKPNIFLSIFLFMLITIVVIGIVIFLVLRVTLKSNEEYIQIGTREKINFVIPN